jgi:RimJ/RimL family protein N-acetyltransferase
MNIHFRELTEGSIDINILECLNKWENDPLIVPLIRYNKDQSALEAITTVTAKSLVARLFDHWIYLIYLNDQMVGQMEFQIDPEYIYKKETDTAWIGIVIGEEAARGQGIGYQALQYLEEEIKKQGIKRIELGVFEFNTNAIKLYKRLGYTEIARINDFTFWQGKMWQDIRMEKYI